MAGRSAVAPLFAFLFVMAPAAVALAGVSDRSLISTVRPLAESPSLPPVAVNPAFNAPMLPPPACDGGRRELEEVARRVAANLASRRIGYNTQPLSDCSGMALRVLEELDNRCDTVIRPDVDEARSASAIAQWYSERGRLVRVLDPLDADDALVPGAITFYGRPGGGQAGLDDVFHIGIVYEVARDEVGRVTGYRLFHGRQPGKVASITGWHRREASPPLGNGTETLVAVAWPSRDLMPAGMAAVADVYDP